MAQPSADPVSTLPMLLGALIFGLLSFTVVAAFLAVSKGGPGIAAPPDYTLLGALGALAVLEPIVYFAVLRPQLMKKARQTAELISDPDKREHALGQQFAINTILAAALLEGVGLFGAVIVLLNAQWPAIVAPVAAAAGLATMLDVRGRLERFKAAATGRQYE